MRHIKTDLALATALMTVAGSASAGVGWQAVAQSQSIPVDSPWALGGLSVLVAVIAVRVIHKFRD
jgi:hypothetical protein